MSRKRNRRRDRRRKEKKPMPDFGEPPEKQQTADPVEIKRAPVPDEKAGSATDWSLNPASMPIDPRAEQLRIGRRLVRAALLARAAGVCEAQTQTEQNVDMLKQVDRKNPAVSDLEAAIGALESAWRYLSVAAAKIVPED